MDSSQFDELVARITNGLSRREAVKGLSAGALASTGIGAVVASGDAAKKGRGVSDENHKNKGKHKRKRKHKKCKLQVGQTRCSRKVCVDLKNNTENCGKCGNACSSQQFCSNGQCVAGTTTTAKPTTTTTTAKPTTTTTPAVTTTTPAVTTTT